MDTKTLIIRYKPLEDYSTCKPSQIRADNYFKNLLKKFDLGELHFVDYGDYKSSLDALNPIIGIVFDEHTAEEVQDYKKDMFLYLTDSPTSVFRRKKEQRQKQKKQVKIFQEIEGLIEKIREEDEDKQEIIRKVAGMGYKEKYEMIQQMLISGKPDPVNKAWELLNSNDVHKDYIWMRVNLIGDCWRAASAKRKEEFLTTAMDQHIKSGYARQIENLTDEDGIEYKQYVALYPDGTDSKYIRLIPIATDKMDKWAYENLLEKYNTPNGPQALSEVGRVKKLYKKHQAKQNGQE